MTPAGGANGAGGATLAAGDGVRGALVPRDDARYWARLGARPGHPFEVELTQKACVRLGPREIGAGILLRHLACFGEAPVHEREPEPELRQLVVRWREAAPGPSSP